MKSIRWIKVKLQETIKPNISNKSKNILGVDRVEQFMQRRNVEVSLSYNVIVVTTPQSSAVADTEGTKQLSYCKEDRAMRPMYGCPENFWESSLRTRLLFQKFVMDFCSDRHQKCASKFEVRNFTRSWDNRGTQKIWAVPGYAHAPFSPKILKGFCSDGPCECIGQICSP